ncbi:glycosyl hydrolase 2 galactose-binding domain-containing protein, partial [Klebsiella pneumoniae]|uniref:glycosyl hydrolase 2 galactose-binding domain-containing protein n=1 Tax=Klebsiella pneumoniae TaxID=573 RepID=UPI00376F3911
MSRAGYDVSRWHVATVPGTVLTTLVDRGVYPDPGYGLNNMAIPEKLSRQAYWYRTQFRVPA